MRLLHPEVRDVSSLDLFDLYDEPGPYLRAGFVASVDGTIAVDGQSAPLGSPADKAVFRALRTVADAVIVGAGTARAEDYGPVTHGTEAEEWREANGFTDQTPLVVVTRSGEVPDDARFLAGPTWFACPTGVSVPGEVISSPDPAELVRALHARGCARLLCEGGPSLLTSLLAADVLDELCLTTSPKAVGDGPGLLGDVPGHDLVLTSLVHDDPGVLLSRWAVVRSSSD